MAGDHGEDGGDEGGRGGGDQLACVRAVGAALDHLTQTLTDHTLQLGTDPGSVEGLGQHSHQLLPGVPGEAGGVSKEQQETGAGAHLVTPGQQGAQVTLY